jgi:hypothetical protein
MGCPICDNKAANCDCTATEREQFDEIESLQAEIARLREERDTLLESQLWGVNCKPLPPGPEGDGNG